ncbi:Crp/Fnr family transcriptional regulator [Kutzneria sp. NPDC051319]|uniref:Crp/Fnr family transcriptional regulator n=1 Tax=Kutzneria sp. NPDC051319 TaxID=3155047 RepID=UPI003426AC8F
MNPARGSLLSYLTEGEREYLLAGGVRRKFGADEVLIREDDPSDFLHVIVDGWVRVSTLLEDGRELVYALRGPGDVLGELAALHGWERTASVRSVEPTTVVQLTAQQFQGVLRSRPEIGIAVIKSLAVRLREAEGARVVSVELDISHRLARHLARLMEERGRTTVEGIEIDTPFTQEEIANQLGASRRAVARAMAMLRSRGVLSTGRRRIVVERPDVLRSLACL